MPAQPAIARICEEKQRLSDNLLQAVTAITTLQYAETQEVIKGGQSLERMAIAVNAARGQWNEARDAYMAHVYAHG